MEPVHLPNDIFCSGFTDTSSVILNQNVEEFAIMPFPFAKKIASHFLMFICQMCVVIFLTSECKRLKNFTL